MSLSGNRLTTRKQMVEGTGGLSRSVTISYNRSQSAHWQLGPVDAETDPGKDEDQRDKLFPLILVDLEHRHTAY